MIFHTDYDLQAHLQRRDELYCEVQRASFRAEPRALATKGFRAAAARWVSSAVFRAAPCDHQTAAEQS